MKRFRRFFFAATFITLLLALAPLAWFTHQASSSILVPQRRATTDWHRDFLDHPDRHSLDIHPFTATGPRGVTLDAFFITSSQNPGAGERYQNIQKLVPQPPPAPGPSPPAQNGTILWLHGKDSIKENALPIAERFIAAGFNFICYDARAHGQSGGKYITYGPREAEDITTILDAAEETFGRTTLGPYAAFGNSLGAAVILQSLPREPRLRAGVTIAAFADFQQLTRGIAARRLPSPLDPLRHLTLQYAAWRADFNPRFASPAAHAQFITVPTMIVHGENDRLIPAHHGRQIYNAIPHQHKVWRLIPGADHRTVLLKGGDLLYADIIRFIQQALKSNATQDIAVTNAPAKTHNHAPPLH
jgi:alpha-beta hydrolase superfamily lysophospholipase